MPGLPGVRADVESEGIDTRARGKFNIRDPVVDSVGEGVAHHMVGDDIFRSA